MNYNKLLFVKIKLIPIVLIALSLGACMPTAHESEYQPYVYDDSMMYPANYGMSASGVNYLYQDTHRVAVPNSYHVGENHSPVSFKDRDKDWVSQQNPQGYTIQIADDAKASSVAQKLFNTPKSDRMAQIRYQRDGKSYYKGVYGTYSDEAAAKKALESLPPEIQQGAGVTNWSAVQGGLE